MADNAPNAVQVGSYPNVTIPLHKAVTCHIASFDVAGGTPAVDNLLSTAGITVVNGAAGIYVLGFPAGGTGAIGFANVCAPLQGTAAGFCFAIASGTSSYATGALDLRAFQATDGAAADLTGKVTVMIYVIKA